MMDKYSRYIIIILLLLVVFSCTAENINNSDHFEGFWAIDEEKEKSIKSFLIIQAIEDSYLIISVKSDSNDGTIVSWNLWERKSRKKIKVELWDTKYTIKWKSDESGEWLEMYVSPNDEDYSYLKRVETFSLDKF